MTVYAAVLIVEGALPVVQALLKRAAVFDLAVFVISGAETGVVIVFEIAGVFELSPDRECARSDAAARPDRADVGFPVLRAERASPSMHLPISKRPRQSSLPSGLNSSPSPWRRSCSYIPRLLS